MPENQSPEPQVGVPRVVHVPKKYHVREPGPLKQAAQLLGLAAVFAVVVAILLGIGVGLSGDQHHAPMDFGQCERVEGTDTQICTYDDGHLEVLNLGDMTGR